MRKIHVLSDLHQSARNSAQTVYCCWESSGPTQALVDQCISQKVTAAQVNSALELHQLVAEVVQTADREHTPLGIIMVLVLGEKIVFCNFQAEVWLYRPSKVAPLLTAEPRVQIIEGANKKENTFVLALEKLPELQSTLEQLQQQQAGVAQVAAALQQRAVVAQVIDEEEEVLQSLAGFASKRKSTQPRQFLAAWQQLFVTLSATLFSKDVYVRKQNTGKLMRIVIPVVILIVLCSAVGMFVLGRRRAEQQLLAQLLAPTQAQLSEIKQKVVEKPLEARQQTDEAIANLETTIQQYQGRARVVAGLHAQLTELKNFSTSISGTQEFPELPQFFDLSLAESTFVAQQMDVNDDTLLFVDTGRKRVIALSIEKKQYTALPIGDQSELRDAVLNKSSVYLLGNGILRFTLGSTEAATPLKGSDDANGTAPQLVLFGQNLYVVNKDKRNIFRYSIDSAGKLSDPVGWVQAGQKFPFEQANSIAIDGDIWVSAQDGQLAKFTTGRQVEFEVTGLKDPFSSPTFLYTKDDQQNLYVLEPQKERLVILSKKGEFLREVKSTSLASTTAVVVEEKLGKAFVLSGQNVYEIKL